MGIEAAIISAAVGGYSANKASKAHNAGLDQAREDQMRSYNFSEPYIQRSYDRGEEALNRSLDMGAYKGQTYADMNPYEVLGNNFMGNMGMYAGAQGFGITNQGAKFAQNYSDLFEAGKADRMGKAQEYAINNSQPMIDAAMRGDYRNLTEQTLPGINMASSGGGNINSSRAGVADALATRGYNDRKADVSAGIQNQLVNQSLGEQQSQFNNMMAANRGLFQGYGAGMDSMGRAGNWMTGAGGAFRGYNQGALDDARARYEDDRDFALNQNIRYQQGMLGQADYESPQNPFYEERGNVFMDTLGGMSSGASAGMNLGGYFG